ncbi:MAG TPA: RNA-binding transcriptional accessory protein [Cyanobacteria bacterium UBA8803]|nr:RNA-binding transcriptional accessory protein [Cyanobacteria bacterium UBA8803]
MLNIPQLLAQELSLTSSQVENTLSLLAEGATIPFIARYRKERTGSLDEVQLRTIAERYTYLTELEERKATILEAIASQGKLTDELKAKIESCLQKNELEDLYLPYRPKRRTRATVAREKGLEPLAELIKSLNNPTAKPTSLEQEASKYIAEEKGVKTAEEALKGASDILAEEVSEKAELRAYLRDYFMQKGVFVSKIKDDYPEGSTKFEMYRSFQAKAKDIAPHNMLALFRGEAEGILNLDLAFDEEVVQSYLESAEIRTKIPTVRDFYREMLKDGFNRLMKTSLITEVRTDRKAYADIESIKTFETNLRELLLSAPAGMKPTLAIDPGLRTGCKVAVLNETGKFLEYQTIFPHTGSGQRLQAAEMVKKLIEKYNIELIAIGNGTASRETDEFIAEVLKTSDRQPIKVIVNESGASIYSASEVAREEFPEQDVTVRGAISIGRRLQDPLAELVKIDPKSIGVGQYQHDVDQKLLKKKLDETVESCVNYVGVDLNTASKELLTFISGLTPTIAKNIVTYRNENGAFINRRKLLKVSKLGPKAFEQAAGFLRIRGGDNPLDNTAVHPESYPVVEAIAKDINVPLDRISQAGDRLKSVDLKKYVTDTVGLPTLRDIISELEKPGRDPRAEFKYATFKEGIKEITDLTVGMELEGIVTNVANFGAFVDIGVHQDGLVHVSQLADRFVDDPKQIVKVGQVVKVRGVSVDHKLKRIGLSMRSPEKASQSSRPTNSGTRTKPKPSTLEDLKTKFNRKT